jgi:hypothetical protein
VDASGAVRGAAVAKTAIDALERSGTSVRDSFQRLQSSLFGLRGAFASLGIGLLARQVVTTAASFERMKLVLENTTGSASRAATVFRQLQDFAAKTPFSLQDLTESFARFAAFGLQPTLKQMTQFGNLAATFDTTFGELQAAVQAAATTSAEPLRKLGVESVRDGNRITVTFRGVSREVEASTAAVGRAVAELSGLFTDGAMDRLLGSVSQRFSNLGDSIGQFINKVGEGGLNKAIADVTGRITDFVSSGNPLASQLGEKLGNAIRTLGDAFAFTAKHVDVFSKALLALIAIRTVAWAAEVGGALLSLSRAVLASQAIATLGAALENILATGVFASLRIAIGGVVTALAGFVATPIGATVAALTIVVGAATAAWYTYRDALVTVNDEQVQLQDVVTGVWENIKKRTDDALKSVTKYISELARAAGLDGPLPRGSGGGFAFGGSVGRAAANALIPGAALVTPFLTERNVERGVNALGAGEDVARAAAERRRLEELAKATTGIPELLKRPEVTNTTPEPPPAPAQSIIDAWEELAAMLERSRAVAKGLDEDFVQAAEATGLLGAAMQEMQTPTSHSNAELVKLRSSLDEIARNNAAGALTQLGLTADQAGNLIKDLPTDSLDDLVSLYGDLSETTTEAAKKLQLLDVIEKALAGSNAALAKTIADLRKELAALDPIAAAHAAGIQNPEVIVKAVGEDGLRRVMEELERGKVTAQDLEAAITAVTEAAVQLGVDPAPAVAELRRRLDELKSATDPLHDAMADVADSVASGLEDALLQFRSFKDVLKGLMQDIVQIIVSSLITTPFKDWLTGILQGGGTGRIGSLGAASGGIVAGDGSVFGGTVFGKQSGWSTFGKVLLGSFTNFLFGGGLGGGNTRLSASQWSAINGELDRVFAANPGTFARGGSFIVPGSGGQDTTPVNFLATPGERVTVTPARDTGKDSRGKINVNIVNNGPPVDARVQERETLSGRQIEIVLDAVSADIARGGRVNRSIGSVTGMATTTRGPR